MFIETKIVIEKIIWILWNQRSKTGMCVKHLDWKGFCFCFWKRLFKITVFILWWIRELQNCVLTEKLWNQSHTVLWLKTRVINQLWFVNLELLFLFLNVFFILLSVMSVDPTIFIDVNRPPLCVTVFLLFVHAEEKVFFRKRRFLN